MSYLEEYKRWCESQDGVKVQNLTKKLEKN